MFRRSPLFDSILGGVLVAGGLGIAGELFNWTNKGNWVFAGITAVLSAIVTFFIIYRLRDDVPSFKPIPYNFRVTQNVIELQFHEDGTITYSKKKSLVSKVHNARLYEDKFHWTGRGRIDIRSVIPEHTVELSDRNGIWQKYRTNFNRTIHRGEAIEIHTIWKLDESEGKMSPFISQASDEPTRELVLRVKFTDQNKPTKIFQETAQSLSEQSAYDTVEVLTDGKNDFEWIIKNPKLLHLYQLRWLRNN